MFSKLPIAFLYAIAITMTPFGQSLRTSAKGESIIKEEVKNRRKKRYLPILIEI